MRLLAELSQGNNGREVVAELAEGRPSCFNRLARLKANIHFAACFELSFQEHLCSVVKNGS